MGVTFQNPEYFWLLLWIPLGWALRGIKRRPASVVFSSVGILEGLARSGGPGFFLKVLRILTVVALATGLARPQKDERKRQVEASGIDMVLAVDLSASMYAHDFELKGQPSSRLDVVKNVLRTFIERRPSDRMGFVAFALEPYLVSPLTLNHDWLQQNLERLQIGLINPMGTAIGSALAMSTNRLRSLPSKSKVIVLLTDGQSNRGQLTPAMAAEAAAAYGIKVHTIFAGTDGMVPVPVIDGNTGRPVRDPSGSMIFEKAYMSADEGSLKEISEKTGGEFFKATDTESLKKIYDRIDELEKTQARVFYAGPVYEYFHWPVSLAGLLLLLELLLSHTRLRQLP